MLHLAGNALVFAGPDLFNEYSHRLVANPIVWALEVVLLVVEQMDSEGFGNCSNEGECEAVCPSTR